ncbi:MAG: hypothetical protein WCF54_03540 [Terracidiphilus sp.]
MNSFVGSLRLHAASRKLAAPLLLFCLGIATTQAKAQSLGYEGPTGLLVTPLALTATSPAKGVGLPAISYHFLAGGPVIGDFSTVSATVGIAKRFEIGYTHELQIAPGGSLIGLGPKLTPLFDSGLDIVHFKANITPGFISKVGTFSVGGVYRLNDQIGVNINNLAAKLIAGANITPINAEEKTANGDVYLVGTKIITQLGKKAPIIVSAGLRGTNAALWGLGGNSPGFEGKAFGSTALVLTGPAKSTIILASEISQQPQHISSATATATFGSARAATLFDIPTSESYALRLVPFARHKLNIDAAVLHAGGFIDNSLLNKLAGGRVDLDMRARLAFAISYGF